MKRKKKAKGPAPIQISDEQLKQIETMAGLGLPIPHIALILGVSKKTLDRRASEDERVGDAIERGRAVANLNVLQTLYSQAVSGKNPAMTIFWAKTRCGFREVNRVEVSGEDGKAIKNQIEVVIKDARVDDAA